ncbi:hypothetical protein niasHT_017975 [Heterodera trifolii]|uniref:Nuclear receptor domain-containing protein n=1 Tax=Heterodera trifolii TaxID=157864 RepID=A0ABD2LBR5_9BILA
MKEYRCANGGNCDIEKGEKCKRCRLNKCLMVGMNPRGVGATKFNSQEISEFVEEMNQQMASVPSSSSSNLEGFNNKLSARSKTATKNGPHQ